MVESPRDTAISDLGFDPEDLPRLLSSLTADFRAHLSESERTRRGLATAFLFLKVLVRSAGFRLTTFYRIAFSLRGSWGLPGRFVAAFVTWFTRGRHGCSIAPTARLHGGLILPHPQGIVIGPDAVVGPRAWIFQNVTIGGSPGREGLPMIGADCRVFPGAVLAGPIKVGRNVVVGANAVVIRDIPPRSLVRSPVAEVTPLAPRWFVDSQLSDET